MVLSKRDKKIKIISQNIRFVTKSCLPLYCYLREIKEIKNNYYKDGGCNSGLPPKYIRLK